LSLKGKIVIITGSSKGIGFAIAKEFAENKGAIVIVCSRHLKQAVSASAQIKGQTFAAKLDVTDESNIKEFIQHVLSKYKRIDVLVNNSGYQFDKNIWYKNFHEVTDEEFDKIMDVDLKGSIRLARAVIPVMLCNSNITTGNKTEQREVEAEEREEGGVIINISSTPAIAGHMEGSPYTIAKAANIALTKCIAMEYGRNNIRAYSMALGNISTKATYESMNEEDRKHAAEEPAMKRWGRPEEVAKVAACIADDSFSYATGNTIVIDGGTVLL
jgi:3-oxoacyl-[acyl-carrier protein] reductase